MFEIDSQFLRIIRDDMLRLTEFTEKISEGLKPGDSKEETCPFCGETIHVLRAAINGHLSWDCAHCGKGFGQ